MNNKQIEKCAREIVTLMLADMSTNPKFENAMSRENFDDEDVKQMTGDYTIAAKEIIRKYDI